MQPIQFAGGWVYPSAPNPIDPADRPLVQAERNDPVAKPTTPSGPGFGEKAIDLTGGLGWGLLGASMMGVPGAGSVGLLGAANNIANVNRMRAALDIAPLSVPQMAGGLLGLNSYGSGGPTGYIGDATFGGRNYAVQRLGGGMMGGGLLGGMFGDPVRTSLTFQEAVRRKASQQLYGDRDGGRDNDWGRDPGFETGRGGTAGISERSGGLY